MSNVNKPERGFRFLTGDVNYLDYGGKWIRRVSETRYHVIELTNWEDAIFRDAEGGPTYCVDLSEIDITSPVLRDARRSMDVDSEDPNPLALVEALHGYGAKAPLFQEDGNNFRTLFRAAVRESKALDDPSAREAAMARPVNKIGSTAAEFAAGDINSAILRGLADGNPVANLMARVGVLRK